MVDRHDSRVQGSTPRTLRAKRPRCVYCGRPCAPPKDGDAVCRHCKAIQRTMDYVPAWDALFFTKVQNLLVFPPSGKAGDWVQPHRILGCDARDVFFVVRRLRRQRWVIQGQRGKGYRLRPFGEQIVGVHESESGAG